MTDTVNPNDPKGMTASELLRKAAADGGGDLSVLTPMGELFNLVGISITKSQEDVFIALADMIDAELAEARRAGQYSGVKPCLNLMALERGWPLIRDGEYISEWMSRCFIPFPLYCNGEPVQLGEDGVSEVRFRRCYKLCSAHVVECTILDDDGEVLAVIEGGERVKRPAPDVLGADGLPVEEGETVWDTESGKELSVCAVANADAGMIQCSDGDGYCEDYDARHLTHTLPDTQERIDADVMKSATDYWMCGLKPCAQCPVRIDGKTPAERYEMGEGLVGCRPAMLLDLLRRQRELDARKGGE